MTVQDLLDLLDQEQTYMVCPYNEETVNLLQEGTISRDDDKTLESISDDYEKEFGANYAMQEVRTFGAMHVEDTIDYEYYSSAYVLILSSIIVGRN